MISSVNWNKTCLFQICGYWSKFMDILLGVSLSRLQTVYVRMFSVNVHFSFCLMCSNYFSQFQFKMWFYELFLPFRRILVSHLTHAVYMSSSASIHGSSSPSLTVLEDATAQKISIARLVSEEIGITVMMSKSVPYWLHFTCHMTYSS